ncbi:MAG: anthranilate synthase component I [Bacteroidetes bacterium]|nr:anthranilate synthase component I [Rhodothermaceae bacterium RA]RMH66410.1 MAG: anthranilate synthase component I [Bacteroidota bacterium]
MTFEAFCRHVEQERRRGHTRFVLPVYQRLSADLLTPVSAFLTLREPGTYGFLLESVEGGEKLARYSFLGTRPYRIVRARGRRVEIEDTGAHPLDGPIPEGDVFAVMQHLLDRYTEADIPGLPRFTGGAVGYLGYDAVRLVEHLPDAPPDDLGLPDAVWCFYDTVAAFDHVKHQMVLMASAFIDPETDLEAAYAEARSRLEALAHVLSTHRFPNPAPVTLSAETMASNVDRDAFEAAVERARHYIYEGDIFQVVLSQRFSMSFEGDRFNLYRALRQVNPSPYLFYLDFDDFALVGSSPEVLVRVEDGRAEVLPIAGTRRRGVTPEEDRQLEADLLADPKERAEHLMLVDLGRNDLGRVCQFASVQVDRYAYIERYSHVMHIVSSVSGRLETRRGAMDVLAACFPAGTVSGAPKVRAMEIIDELEPTRRGVYAGAVGYVDFSGNLDTCIAIRTMVVHGRRIYVQAGAGIVADSIPANEYQETVNKAQALRQAMLVASQGLL